MLPSDSACDSTVDGVSTRDLRVSHCTLVCNYSDHSLAGIGALLDVLSFGLFVPIYGLRQQLHTGAHRINEMILDSCVILD